PADPAIGAQPVVVARSDGDILGDAVTDGSYVYYQTQNPNDISITVWRAPADGSGSPEAGTPAINGLVRLVTPTAAVYYSFDDTSVRRIALQPSPFATATVVRSSGAYPYSVVIDGTAVYVADDGGINKYVSGDSPVSLESASTQRMQQLGDLLVYQTY